ncbi:MAG: inorganic pyrophosphatase [Bacteroidia bacterium]|jgi:inorganic pyrophosphatase|nr:inorganic pyrophosphatase [Bacteroidia bacterium]
MYPTQKAHPWHGISPGAEAPGTVTAFIEIVPADTIKYEIDKQSGYLKIDRPQLFSNIVPALYGFIPQTFCGKEVAEYCSTRSGRQVHDGDGDPLDICVLSERPVTHGDILVTAIPIGGFRLIDKHEADDKIIAVLKSDAVYGGITEIGECPTELINRLRHYFLTYKVIPGEARVPVELAAIYGREEAMQVIRHSMNDYNHNFRLGATQ